MKITRLHKLACALLCAATVSAQAEEKIASSSDGKIYFGIEGGYSLPAKNKFKDKSASGKEFIGKLKGTGVYEAKIGYRFYPNIALEFAYAYRPAYKLGIYPSDITFSLPVLPDNPLNISNISSKTKVQSHTAMLNLVYEAQTENAYRPYFLVGVGYAHVTPKQSPMIGTLSVSPANRPAYTAAAAQVPAGSDIQKAMGALGAGGSITTQIGRIKKFTSERLGWRLGGGMVYDMNDHFSLVGGVKLEVINKIGLHTSSSNPLTGAEISKDSVKKTIGVLDFTLGLRYTL
ncbi:MAG: hypothetical protein RLZZ59_898 [Pseudomonadota bacterium]|jgi:opacity protein-like surface antigen